MATEFVVSVKSTGGDYADISDAEAALQCDLTAATTKVFSITVTGGTIDDGDTVTGQTSGATGTCEHATSSQILITGISGTFQSGEEIRGSPSERADLNDAGDSAIVRIEPYIFSGGLSDACTIDGWTCDTTNFVRIIPPVSERHDGTPGTGFYIQSALASTPIDNRESSTELRFLEINTTGVAAACIRIGLNVVTWVDSCLVNCASASGYGINFAYSNGLFTNNIAIGCNTGLRCGANNTNKNYNNGAESCGDGFYGGGEIISNCWAYNNTAALRSGGSGDASSANNYDDDATNPLPNKQATISSSDFTDATNDDYSLASGSSMISGGSNFSTDFTNDITNATRQTSPTAWDAGPFYFAGAGSFTGTGVATLQALTASAAGTFAGLFTGSATATLQALTGSAAGTFAGLFTGSATATLQAVTGDAAGTFNAPGVSGAGAGDLQAITGTASGTFTGSYTGTGVGDLQALTGNATGTFTPTGISGAGAGLLQALTASAAGTFTGSYTGTGVGSFQAITGDAVGTFAGSFTGAGAGDLQALTGSAAGTFVAAGNFSGVGAGLLEAVTGSSSGTFTGSHTGTGVANLSAMTGAALGVWYSYSTGTGVGLLQAMTGAAVGTGTDLDTSVPDLRTISIFDDRIISIVDDRVIKV